LSKITLLKTHKPTKTVNIRAMGVNLEPVMPKNDKIAGNIWLGTFANAFKRAKSPATSPKYVSLFHICHTTQ
jgi:hypothetical protein